MGFLYLKGITRQRIQFSIQYDSLIKRTALDYFDGKLDLQIGWAIEDVIQFARLRILQAMKKLNLDRCSFPYFIKNDNDLGMWQIYKIFKINETRPQKTG